MMVVPLDLAGFSWIDGLLALCLLVPAIRGWQTGLVPGLLRLGGVVGGALVGWFQAPLVTGLVPDGVGLPPEAALPWVAALGCAVLGWVVGIVAGWAWRRSTKGDPIGWLDRVAGGVLGAAKGAAFALVFLAVLQTSLPATRPHLQHSLVGSQAVAPLVHRLASLGTELLHSEGGAP
ncbi:MAG: CvpA family protein [Fibrobacteria bacterium]|nr:CvpA family protein [Fibrobacteria bacterium]